MIETILIIIGISAVCLFCIFGKSHYEMEDFFKEQENS